jgi:hypothetical protein
MTDYEQHANVDLLRKVKEYQHPLTYLLNLMGRSDIQSKSLDDIQKLDKAFASVYNIVELIPYLMKLKYRRTILDDLYPGKEKAINEAYQNFLANPGKYAGYYVPNTHQRLADLEDAIPYDPRIPPRGSVGELRYTFDEINKYKEEEKKNKGELKDIASPPPPPPPDVSEVLDDALAEMDKSMESTVPYTPPHPPPSSTDDAGDILAAASRKFLESKPGGSSRKYLRRRFKKSKSKSKSKKSKSKSKTKPKLKSKYKTKYRKQNK